MFKKITSRLKKIVRPLHLRMATANTNKCDMYAARLQNLEELGKQEDGALFASIADKIRNCAPSNPCHNSDCYDCTHKPGRAARHQLSPNHQGGVARNPQKRMRQRIEERFRGVPEDQIGILTLHCEPAMLEGAAVLEVIKRYREKLKYLFKTKLRGGNLWGSFEVAPKHASDVNPDCYNDKALLHAFPVDEVVGMVHIHAIIWVPGHDREQVKSLLEREFSGSRQVRLTAVRHEYDQHGNDYYGIGGAAEYAAKRRFNLRFGERNPEVHKRMVALYEELKRNRTNISLGQRKTSDLSLIRTWDFIVEADGRITFWNSDSGMTYDDIVEDMHQDYLNYSNYLESQGEPEDYEYLIHGKVDGDSMALVSGNAL